MVKAVQPVQPRPNVWKTPFLRNPQMTDLAKRRISPVGRWKKHLLVQQLE